ncbi:MAG TPA: S9 family peptidase [Vicinamibacterales bacterium]|nr:S9 family peptidase [Vicinamibacterales bacterium]
MFRTARARIAGALLVLLLLPARPGAQPAAEREALTHERLWSFHRVGAPVASPDGKWVVVPVTEPSYDPQKDVSDLWIVAADGSAPPRRLTSTRGAEGGPSWSRDSRRLAFSARRDDDEVTQIYVMDIAQGGEAQRITNAPTSASAPSWSPDGTKIAFQAALWRGATDEESNRKTALEKKNAKSKARIYDSFPVRNWDQWVDESKPHLWVVEVGGDRQARSLFAASALARSPGFGSDGLTATWSPDGASVLFAAADRNDAGSRAMTPSHIWQVAAASGGEPVRLTPDTIDATTPRFRPDGRALCFTASDARPAIYSLARIGCIAWPAAGPSSSVTLVTKDLDRAVVSWAFTPDSQTLYVTAEDSGHERIYSMPASGGAARIAVDAPQGVFTGLQIPQAAATTALLANWESAVNPAEIVRIDPSAGTRKPLTTFNVEKAKAIDWQPLREFWFTGRGGRRIHSMIALPPNFDERKRYPLFVLIHGGHANMWRDSITYRWNYHLLAQPGLVVLMTDYRGSTGYGEKFTLDILGDPLAGPADDINDAADEAIKRFPFIDGTRQAAGGASYGGHLTNWLAGTTSRYKALISHAGLATLDMQWGTSDLIYHREIMMGGPYWENPQKWLAQSPLGKAGSFKTPMLMSVGENDFRVPEGNTLAMYSALQRMNVPSRLIVWPDENHWIQKGENSRVFYREVRAWLEKYLLAN